MVAGLFGGLTGSKTKPVIKPELKPTVLFAMGDMNFRVAKPYLECMRVLNTIKQSKLKGSELQEQIDYMLEKDQLRLAMRKVAGLKNLRESRISFLPTYKLEKQEDLYDTEKQRTPSWTDRVLTYAEENDYLVPLEYSSITSVHNSDHR